MMHGFFKTQRYAVFMNIIRIKNLFLEKYFYQKRSKIRFILP
jgi:hypothetical protein